MVIVEVSVVPLGTDSTSLSNYVADCIKILMEEKKISYQLAPMGTILEGELDVVLEVIRKMHESPFTSGAMRVSTLIKIDDRRDKKASMVKKVSAVEEKI
jgi:uncharacterized protein (TIGR00106 family)